MAALTGSWRHCPPRAACTRSRARAQITASLCPYTTLGVSATADEREIKKAYRQLALKYHPDVSSIPDAHVKFLTIQQAYDLLSGKARGKEIDLNKPRNTGNGWDFHDWFWQFKSSRRWDPYGTKQHHHHAATSSSASGFQPRPEDQETLRSQLAGLRHRAAIRATMRRSSSDDASTASSPSDGPSVNHQASESFWDSSDVADGAHVGAAQASTGNQASNWSQNAARRFVPTEEKKGQVMDQLAGLKRKAAMKQQF